MGYIPVPLGGIPYHTPSPPPYPPLYMTKCQVKRGDNPLKKAYAFFFQKQDPLIIFSPVMVKKNFLENLCIYCKIIYLYIKIMKHLLNNISHQEKKNILEQHKGGIVVSNKNFQKLLTNKLGNVKPIMEVVHVSQSHLIEQQTEEEKQSIRGTYLMENDSFKKTFKKLFDEYYTKGSTELKLPDYGPGFVINSYNTAPDMFWVVFDEYFSSMGITPPTKVYIGDLEIKRKTK